MCFLSADLHQAHPESLNGQTVTATLCLQLECKHIEVDLDKAKDMVLRDRAMLAIAVPFTKLRAFEGQLPVVPREGIADVLTVRVAHLVSSMCAYLMCLRIR